jgi:phosphoglycerate dehydrogenase-like enzyme
MKIACTVKLNDNHRKIIEQACPEAELVFPETRMEIDNPYHPTIVDPLVRDCEVVLGLVNPKGLAQSAPNLKWIHLTGAGVDHVLQSDLLEQRQVVLTNSSGTSAPWIGEYVIGVMLQHSRGLDVSLRAKMRHEWFHQSVRALCQSLRGKAVGIIGYGSIGRAAACLAQPFGMKVLALKRDPSEHKDPGWSLPGMGDPEGLIPSQWFGPDERTELVRLSDYIVVAPPLTAETRNFLGAREFAAARPGAYLINVSRGEVIDQDALIEALNSRRLGGACLDVTTPEPLNLDSPLWDMETVALTFHTSAARPISTFYDLACELFAENLRRFMSGREMLNVIDPIRGY